MMDSQVIQSVVSMYMLSRAKNLWINLDYTVIMPFPCQHMPILVPYSIYILYPCLHGPILPHCTSIWPLWTALNV